MKTMISAYAAILLSGSQALAGPCASQIAAFEQHLSSRDAGAGPILGSQSGTGAANQISEAGGTTRATEASRMAAEVRTGDDSKGSKGMGPTGAAGEATAGAAASPQDVRLQQQGKPTQAQAAKNASPAAAAGEGSAAGNGGPRSRAPTGREKRYGVHECDLRSPEGYEFRLSEVVRALFQPRQGFAADYDGADGAPRQNLHRHVGKPAFPDLHNRIGRKSHSAG